MTRASAPFTALALFVAFAFACSSGGATSDERHPFTDGNGRSCEAVLAKTSPTSAPVSQTLECDGDKRTCSSESSPCFVLNIDRDSFGIRNCPACCRGSASSFVSSQCSDVICETDADCVYRLARCVGGSCTCPNGYCD